MLWMSAILNLVGGDALGSSWSVEMFDPSVTRLRSSDFKLSFLIGWDERLLVLQLVYFVQSLHRIEEGWTAAFGGSVGVLFLSLFVVILTLNQVQLQPKRCCTSAYYLLSLL
jgi:hypothetical protein